MLAFSYGSRSDKAIRIEQEKYLSDFLLLEFLMNVLRRKRLGYHRWKLAFALFGFF